MEKQYRDALPKLSDKISFEIEGVTALDMYYSDGSAKDSFFKLIFRGTNSRDLRSVVFIFADRWWISYGQITDQESLAIHDWIDDLSSKGSS